MRVSDDEMIVAVSAFWDAWRASPGLPEDERSGVAIGAALEAIGQTRLEPTPRFQVTRDEWAEAVRESRLGEPLEWDHDTVFSYLNTELAKRPTEPAQPVRPAYESPQPTAEADDLFAVGKRVFNRHTGARGTVVEWPDMPRRSGYLHAILWDGGVANDVRIVELPSLGLLHCAEPAPRALPTREEIAAALSKAYCTEGDSDGYVVEADYVLDLLRKHASPASASGGEVEALRAQVERLAAANGFDAFRAEQAERERDEACTELAGLRARIGREVEAAVNEQLAARPEPVVIDEALAGRIGVAFQARYQSTTGSMYDAMLSAIRSVLGDSASVTGPVARFDALDASLSRAKSAECELDKLRAVLAKTDPCEEYTSQLRRIADAAGVDVPIDQVDGAVAGVIGELRARHEGCQDLLARYDEARAELAASEGARAVWCLENDKLRAELQTAQRRLAEYEQRIETQFCTDADRTGEDLPIGMALRRLSDKAVMAVRQYEALQAACEPSEEERDALEKTSGPNASNKLRHHERFRAYFARVQAALKPALPSIAERNALTVGEMVGLKPAELSTAPDAGAEETHAEYARRKAWQHISSDGDSHTFRHASGEERTLEGFPTAQDAAGALDEPATPKPQASGLLAVPTSDNKARLAPDERHASLREVYERLERLERDNGLVWRLIEYHTQASINTVIREASEAVLAARKASNV